MSDLTRRDALTGIAVTAAATGCTQKLEKTVNATTNTPAVNPVISVKPLGFPWQTPDPFLFCVHHDDRYPHGNEVMGPNASLAGRNMGMDFEGKDGWRMYHGDKVPGFPQHPHRGFETVTVVRNGLLDHSDSMGAAARYGEGDVQWLTAGKGILHSEMFPLLKKDSANPVELFQIWLNLPRVDKLAPPHFSMFWSKTIPRETVKDASGRTIELTVVAGNLGAMKAPPPPPKSWAARAESDVAIWTVKMAPGAQWTLPASKPGSNRYLYFFRGSALKAGGTSIPPSHVADLKSGLPALLEAGPDEVEFLILQGQPIREPVVHHGPFVMTSREEIYQTIAEYQQTQFGGWPWPSNEPVHPRDDGRFARYADGKIDKPA